MGAPIRIVVISDTHGGHDALGRMEGDVLIHCGDAEAGYECDDADMDRIDAWFGAQDFDLILCTGGNHDFALENRVGNGVQPFQNATFLQDSGMTWQGVRFHGAPWVPDLEGFEFYADEAHLRLAWAAIPDDVDVLITHTPPLGGWMSPAMGFFWVARTWRTGCPWSSPPFTVSAMSMQHRDILWPMGWHP